MQSVVVEEILWQGLRGGAIFRAVTGDGKKHRIVAWDEVMPRPPVLGETWDINGVVRRNPEHGPQVEADYAALRKPSGRLIVNAIINSSAFPGVGKKYAQDLWDEFGEDLYGMLAAGDPTPFETVLKPGLSKVLVQGWRDSEIGVEVYRWLDKHGVPVWISSKILGIYGNDAIVKLNENPYRLMAFISWSQVDKVALSLGISHDDPRRLIAVAEAAIRSRLDGDGHTWTSRDALRDIVSDLLGKDKYLAEKTIDLAVEAFSLVEVDGGLQGLGPHSMEKFVASRTMEMVSGRFLSKHRTTREQASPERVNDIIDRFDAGAGISLNARQRAAVWTAMANPFVCITGGAGVGKTTVLRVVNDAADELSFSAVYQMALSGRASKRMSEATGRRASTIASFIGRVDSGEIDLEGGGCLVIIDESSMLDLATLYRVMRRMPPGNRLVLVGDPAQLSPIGFGLTFHSMVGHPMIPTVELMDIHRSAAATGIPQASVAIRNGGLPDLREYAGLGEGICFIDCAPEKAVDQMLRVVDDLGGDRACQIVGSVKGGPAGTEVVNSRFHSTLHGASESLFDFAVGEPVMWTRNDYDRGLLNGSFGRVVGLGDRLTVDFDGEHQDLGKADVRDLTLAYGITVHKGQGSQFERVVVPVYGNRLLDRTMIYTAVTRASSQVVLVGDRRAFKRAVEAPPLPSICETGMTKQLNAFCSLFARKKR